MAYTLFIVVPCYNEREVLPISVPEIVRKLNGFIAEGRVTVQSRLLFVNDGSKDETWEIIKEAHDKYPCVTGISLAHNAGEQNAYLAGLFTAVKYADAVITTDCDLQDDINAMDEMLDAFENGKEIVYGVRSRREKESFLYRRNAGLFYKLMKLCGSELPEEHSQYRLMSKQAIEMLSDYGETNIFLPALIPTIGLKSTTVAHKRTERAAGKTNYSTRKLIKLAVEAITSFSSAPLMLITLFFFVCALGMLGSLIALIAEAAKNNVFDVQLCILFSVLFVGTGVSGGLRVLGEYICKNYTETKHRPRYHIAASVGLNE